MAGTRERRALFADTREKPGHLSTSRILAKFAGLSGIAQFLGSDHGWLTLNPECMVRAVLQAKNEDDPTGTGSWDYSDGNFVGFHNHMLGVFWVVT